jgi:hypothetical protein
MYHEHKGHFREGTHLGALTRIFKGDFVIQDLSQGRPSSLRPTLGYGTESRWDSQDNDGWKKIAAQEKTLRLAAAGACLAKKKAMALRSITAYKTFNA